jgi:hypothetical protein
MAPSRRSPTTERRPARDKYARKGIRRTGGRSVAVDEFSRAAKPALQAGIWSSRAAPACQAVGTSTVISHDLTISTARADALFASALQHGDEPRAAQVHQAIVAAAPRIRDPGCGTDSAAYGEHPQTAGITRARRPLPAGLPARRTSVAARIVASWIRHLAQRSGLHGGPGRGV